MKKCTKGWKIVHNAQGFSLAAKVYNIPFFCTNFHWCACVTFYTFELSKC